MNAPQLTPSSLASGSSWPASLSLTVGKTARGSRLLSKSHKGPLYIQKAFYPEGQDLAHIYLLHPPGGLVSGDSLFIGVDCKEQAACVLTTPGAGKLYKAREDKRIQRQSVALTVEQRASIEWFPQETIVFPGACGELDLQIDLAEQAKTIGWEVMCYGLPACEAPFLHGSVNQRLSIKRNGIPLFIDQLSLKGTETSFTKGKAGLASANATGIFWAGQFDQYPELLMQKLVELCQGFHAAPSFIRGFICLRYLGQSAAEAKALFVEAWHAIRPVLLAKEACPPAIWHC